MSSEQSPDTSAASMYFSMCDTSADLSGDGKDESTLEAETTDCSLSKFEQTLKYPRTPRIAALHRSAMLASAGKPAAAAEGACSTPISVQRNKENKTPNVARALKKTITFALEDEESPVGMNGTRIEEGAFGTVENTGKGWVEVKEDAMSPTLLLEKMGADLSDLNLEEPPFSGRPSMASVDFEVMIPRSVVTSMISTDSDSQVELVSSFEDEPGKAEFEKIVSTMESAKVAELTAPAKPRRKSWLPKPTISSQFRATTERPPLKPTLSLPESSRVPTTLNNRRSLHPTALKPPMPVTKQPLNPRQSFLPAYKPPMLGRRSILPSKPPTFRTNTTQPQRRLSGVRLSPRLSINAPKTGPRRSIMPPPPPASETRKMPPPRRSILPASSVVSKRNEIKCQYCDKKFALAQALQLHMREKCHKVPPGVKKGLLSNDLAEREKNLRTKGSARSSDCLSSDSTMPPPKSAGRPNRSHAGILRTPTKSIECKQCKQFFGDPISYADHVKEHKASPGQP